MSVFHSFRDYNFNSTRLYKLCRFLNKHLDITIIVLSLIIAILVQYYIKDRIEIVVSIILAGITISLSVRQYKIENDKIFKELFIMYNEKYDNKFNNILNEILQKSRLDENYQLNPIEKQLLTDYLNLCAEEYLWNTKGRIDSIVWKSWERGMRYYISNPVIKQHMINEMDQKDSYYGLFEYLKLNKNYENNNNSK